MTTLAAVVRLYLGHPSADGHPNRKALRKAMLDIVQNPHGEQSAFATAMNRVRELEAQIAEIKRVPRRDLIAPKVLAKMDQKPISQPRSFHCKACGRLGVTNRHHPFPQSIRKTTFSIRLCLPCHSIIHTLSNSELATIPAEEQIRYIQSVNALKERPVYVSIAVADQGMGYEEYQRFLGR